MEDQNQREEEYKPEECEKQLEAVREYVEGFNNFMQLMNEPVDTEQKPAQGRARQTYYQKLEKNIENPKNDACKAIADEIEDFRIFDP